MSTPTGDHKALYLTEVEMNTHLSVAEVKEMIADGDIDMDEFMDHFRRLFARDPKLTEDQICECIGKMDDDDADEFCKLVIAMEQVK